MSTDKIMYNPQIIHNPYILYFDPHKKISRHAILYVWFIKLKVSANKYIKVMGALRGEISQLKYILKNCAPYRQQHPRWGIYNCNKISL